MTADALPPGRRLYAQARSLLRAKRRHQLKGVTRIPREPGKVLQFPNKKEEVE
jgi:hypothetical protein